MITLTCSVTIGGDSYTNYVVEINRNHSICNPGATGTVSISHESPNAPTVYEEIVIYELGTKVFTGYVTNVTKGRLPVEYQVEFQDPTIKLIDYWLEQEYVSAGETAEYWIGFFCDLAGVNYVFDVTYSLIVPGLHDGQPGYSWQYTSAMDVIKQLIVIGGFYVYSDPDGIIHFGKKSHGAGPTVSTGTNMLSFRRDRTITPTRNKAVVFGKYPIAEQATVTIAELSGVTKTAVVASPYIEASSYAADLAANMLLHFKEIGDILTVEVLGDPDFRIGLTTSVTEDWSGFSGNGIITSLRSTMSNSGYTMILVINEFCPFIWGYFTVTTVTLYAGTDGQGVWKSTDLALTWTDITGNIPSGISRYVRGISASGNVVWAATLGGVYRTDVGGTTWSDFTPTVPSGVTSTDWTDVEMAPAGSGVVYVLMDDLINHRVYLHKTVDNGLSWSNVEVA